MITLDKVCYAYPNGAEALRGITARIGSCENVAVVGRPGSGKSTLLKLLSGTLEPDSGTLTRYGSACLCGQEDPIFSFSCTVRQALTQCRGSLELADWALKSLHLTPLADKKPLELSASQSRALKIALALAQQPDALLLDEPLAMLWPEIIRGFYSALQFHPHTKVIVSSDLDLPLRLCSRVLVLKNGALLADGDPQCLLRNLPLLKEAGLELPMLFQRQGVY